MPGFEVGGPPVLRPESPRPGFGGVCWKMASGVVVTLEPYLTWKEPIQTKYFIFQAKKTLKGGC